MEETVLMKYKFLDEVQPKDERAFREEMCWFFNPCTKRIIQHYHLQNWNKWTGQRSPPEMPGNYKQKHQTDGHPISYQYYVKKGY